MLLDDGSCDKTYIDSMIKKIEEYGSYMVTNKKIAIPHSKNDIMFLKLLWDYLL